MLLLIRNVLYSLIMLPLSGILYANFSSRWTMIVMLIFQQAGIMICGFAPSSAVFICGRTISGIGAGGIPVGALVIIDGLVPLEQRPVFTASSVGSKQQATSCSIRVSSAGLGYG